MVVRSLFVTMPPAWPILVLRCLRTPGLSAARDVPRPALRDTPGQSGAADPAAGDSRPRPGQPGHGAPPDPYLLCELCRMSQTSRFTRARQLTSTVLPGRRPDGYADLVAGRLRRIAAARGTGMLAFSGRSDGSIYFRDGKVAYAESTRTPGPARHDQPGPDQPPLNKITAILAIT